MFNAPFHCYEKVFIFNNWIEGAGHGRQVEQEVIIRSSNLLFHFRGHNNDLLVLKQWKGSLTTRAQLFEGRLALNLGLNLTLVSFSCAQKHFLG